MGVTMSVTRGKCMLCAAILAVQVTSVQAELFTADIGLASDKNFVVQAPPGGERAGRILTRANEFRRTLAKEFGIDLAEGAEHVCIHFDPSETADDGKTLLGRGEPYHSHMIWLRTSEESALGSTLQHELVHTVLHARFPKGMPLWANEGLASRYDDGERLAIRARVLHRLLENGQLPPLANLFTATSFRRNPQIRYATAESVTLYLLENGGAKKFLSFVEDGTRVGWDAALRRHYKINEMRLQENWEAWVATQFTARTDIAN